MPAGPNQWVVKPWQIKILDRLYKLKLKLQGRKTQALLYQDCRKTV